MSTDDIPEQEHEFREEALTYLVSRYERASLALEDRQFDAFRDFVQLWLEAFDWRTPDGVARWLQIPHAQRVERMERFRRQAESWDVTLELNGDESRREDAERAQWRRDYDRTKKRLRREAAQAGWEQVRATLEAEHRLRAMPSWLRESFDVLGLPARATLADARRQYRELAKRHHPDKSGSTELMARVNAAWAQVESFFAEAR